MSMGAMTLIMTMLTATFPLTQYLGRAVFATWVWAFYFTFSGTFSMLPVAVAKAFGDKHYSTNYGMIFSCQVNCILYFKATVKQ